MTIDWDLLIVTFCGFLAGFALAKFQKEFKSKSNSSISYPKEEFFKDQEAEKLLKEILPIIKTAEGITFEDDFKTDSKIIYNKNNTLKKIYIHVINNNSRYVWNIKHGLKKLKSKH